MIRPIGALLALAERHKIFTAVFLGVAPLMILAEIFPPDQVQLWGILLSLPVALVFIVSYLPERPGREWFGTSLLVLAYAVVTVSVVAAMVRLFGPQPWYQYLVTAWIGMTGVALIGRTWVLLHGQWMEQRHVGGWLRRHLTHHP